MADLEIVFFCLRSLWTEYGWSFLTRVAFKHPVRTWRGIRKYVRSDQSNTGDVLDLPLKKDSDHFQLNKPKVLGLGFCLKPLFPECPAGRANHSCLYFENRGTIAKGDVWEACQECVIRKLGSLALGAGFDLYIMTSARDILWDLLLPVMEQKQYTFAVLALCSYSFEPFRIALAVAGLRGCLFEFAEGDCQNYSAWRRADKGHKSEITCLQPEDQERLLKYFKAAAGNRPLPEIERKHNTYTPQSPQA